MNTSALHALELAIAQLLRIWRLLDLLVTGSRIFTHLTMSCKDWKKKYRVPSDMTAHGDTTLWQNILAVFLLLRVLSEKSRRNNTRQKMKKGAQGLSAQSEISRTPTLSSRKSCRAPWCSDSVCSL